MKTNEERLWEKIDVRSPDECWPWTASVFPDGYGRFGWRDENGEYRSVRATRVVLGLRPEQRELFACHHCDNPICCNPSHLYVGDYSTNHNDAIRRNRWKPRMAIDECPIHGPLTQLRGQRRCIPCRKEYHQRYNRENRERLNAQKRERYRVAKSESAPPSP